MGWPVGLFLRLLGDGAGLIKCVAKWCATPIERLLLFVAAGMLCAHWFVVDPALRSQVNALQKSVDAEVLAHEQTKNVYEAAMEAAEDVAHAKVAAEIERQGNEESKAITSFRAGTDDLDLRAERLRQTYDRAGVASASCRSDLPSPMARAGGVKVASSDQGFSRAVGEQSGAEPAGLIDPSMSVAERAECTRYAHQLDAILDIDAANAEAAKSELIQVR